VVISLLLRIHPGRRAEMNGLVGNPSRNWRGQRVAGKVRGITGTAEPHGSQKQVLSSRGKNTIEKEKTE